MNSVTRRGVVFLATGCLSGYLKPAPGTFGTLAAVPLFFLCASLPIPVYCGIVAVSLVVAVVVSDAAEKLLGKKDPSIVVIDEIVGYLITMATFGPDWRYIVAGFFLFRIFDIVKPYPAGLINSKMRGGAGIVLDDVVAGIYANAVLQVVRWWGI